MKTPRTTDWALVTPDFLPWHSARADWRLLGRAHDDMARHVRHDLIYKLHSGLRVMLGGAGGSLFYPIISAVEAFKMEVVIR